MRVALYARISTVNHGQDIQTQLMPIQEYAAQRGWEVVEAYTDLGWSGSKERRPNLDRMMADAKKNKFDAVLVWRFDRFARSVRHLLQASEEFQRLKVNFVSLTENVDTTTPMGQLVFTILAAVAQMERALIIERVKAGLARARKQGRRLGRPTVLVDRALLREKHRGGASISLIAKEAGISRSTVRAILKEIA